MRELVGQSSNLSLAETTDGRLVAMVELVILVSEPKYQPQAGGGFAKACSVSDVRFSMGVTGLRSLAKWLSELADDAEEFQGRARSENEALREAITRACAGYPDDATAPTCVAILRAALASKAAEHKSPHSMALAARG